MCPSVRGSASIARFSPRMPAGELISRYVAALQRELELVANDLQPRTIFFGGGTPSLLNLRQWEDILRTMDRLGLLGAQEFTVECNPATVSSDKARLLRDFGVDRISMGVQSLDESLLDRLGRVHSREMVFRSFEILRQAGFENVNLDLMFAIPGQTLDVWRATLARSPGAGQRTSVQLRSHLRGGHAVVRATQRWRIRCGRRPGLRDV